MRDRVVIELAVRDGVAKLDAAFGYADRYDEPTGRYINPRWAKTPPEMMPDTALIVREGVIRAELDALAGEGALGGQGGTSKPAPSPTEPTTPKPDPAKGPTRFFGSVEIDMVRPIKAVETIIDAVVMQLQHSPGTKIKVTLDIEASSDDGFSDADVSVVRDNARQLKFKPESTGFE